MTDELTRFRADVPPADPVAMTKARAALVRETTGGRRTRMWWQVGITGAAVTALAAALFALPSAATKAPPAATQPPENGNGLVHNPDGTITVELREVADVYSANMTLYEEGVRAVILDSAFGGVVECWTKYPVTPSKRPEAPDDVIQPRPNPWGDTLTFHPDRIPDDMWLYIQAMVESPGNQEVQLRCDPGQQVEVARGWVGDTTPGYPNLPPYEGKALPEEIEPSPGGTPPIVEHSPPGSSAVPTR